jgi:hypothetical protein
LKKASAPLAAALIALSAAPVSAQWSWWPFRSWGRYDEDYRLRRDIEEAAEQQRILKKQEYTRSTVQRPAPPQPASPAQGLRNRYILLESRITKLQADRAQAVQGGKPAGEIAALDSQIEQLRMQADTLKAAVGPMQ